MSDDIEFESHDTNNINYQKNGDKKVYLEIPLKSQNHRLYLNYFSHIVKY